MARRGRRRSRRHSGPHGFMGKIKSALAHVGRRPLTLVVAPTLAIAGLLQLIAIPLPNGDGFFARLQSAISSKGTNMFAADNATTGVGNNIFSILAIQLQANLPNALPTLLGAAAAGVFGRIFKI